MPGTITRRIPEGTWAKSIGLEAIAIHFDGGVDLKLKENHISSEKSATPLSGVQTLDTSQTVLRDGTFKFKANYRENGEPLVRCDMAHGFVHLDLPLKGIHHKKVKADSILEAVRIVINEVEKNYDPLIGPKYYLWGFCQTENKLPEFLMKVKPRNISLTDFSLLLKSWLPYYTFSKKDFTEFVPQLAFYIQKLPENVLPSMITNSLQADALEWKF